MGMSNQTEEKELFHAVSLSGGKDSTAMLLLMIERGLPIQAVLTADTGMEFPEMYEHLQKLNDYLFAERGLHLTWLRHPKGFEWLMFEEKKQRPASIENRQRLGVSLYGNGWPGPRVRWCTGQLKTHLIHKEINRLKGQYRAVSYVGIAADEPKRIKSEHYPLVDWGITEKEALQICYDRGYDFGGLYQIYHRCSCWCCPKAPAVSPGVMGAAAGNGQTCVGTVRSRPAGAIQEGLERGTIGAAICGRSAAAFYFILAEGA